VLVNGPDIVLGILNDPLSLVAKGALEDLAPYMRAFDIREEDYFPAAFDGLRGEGGAGIYGINIVLYPKAGLRISSSLFPEGVEDGLGAERLVSVLEAYEGDAVYDSVLLDDLLDASDSLCGMVDWENETCDFSGGMLKRILELYSRFKSQSGNNVLSGSMSSSIYIYGNIYGNKEEMAKRGMAALGCLFDDGWHAGIWSTLRMSVSSASPYKEGAWEFIRFLLSEEEQARLSWVENTNLYPSNRKVFDELAAREISEGSPMVDVPKADGTTFRRILMGQFWDDVPPASAEEYYSLTEEKVESVRRMLEGARAIPLRTDQIQIIIWEEAAVYFAGDRSVDEVCANIQNRVQLYLNEHQ